MEIWQLMDQYGLLNILIGLAATILCGCVKLPIVKAIKSKGYGEKEVSNRIRNYCTLIVSVISIAAVVTIAIVTKRIDWSNIVADCLLSITCSKVIYALYEGKYADGNGVISLKKWAHALINKIKEKLENKVPENVKDVVDVVQETLIEETHLPLTKEQLQALAESLRKKL